MGALKEYGSKADIAKMCIEAGINIVLECSGNLEDTAAVLEALPEVPLRDFADIIDNYRVYDEIPTLVKYTYARYMLSVSDLDVECEDPLPVLLGNGEAWGY